MQESAKGTELLLAASMVRQRCEKGRADDETLDVSDATAEICLQFISTHFVLRRASTPASGSSFKSPKPRRKLMVILLKPLLRQSTLLWTRSLGT